MASKERANGYWTRERCYDEAHKYLLKSDFRKYSGGAYEAAKRNKWFEDYTWFFSKHDAICLGQLNRNNKRDLTREKCKELARDCVSRGDLEKKHPGVYNSARKHGWLDDYTWFKVVLRPKGYWDIYENCLEEAIKYKTRNCFRLGCSTAYRAAKRNGWLDEWFDETNRKHVDDEFLVYVYEDDVNKSVYVGLTLINRLTKRHYEHRTRNDDAVHVYFKNDVPMPKVKIDYLYAEEAQYYEGWYVDAYRNAGWKILNKARTGIGASSLGGSIAKWNYDTCKEEADKYFSKEDFRRGNCGAYAAAKQNKWLDEWFGKYNAKPNGYWNSYDNCKEAAGKCKTKNEFSKKYNRAYCISIQNGWINDFEFEEIIKPKGYWNYDTCKEEAMKYETRKDFQKGCGSAYNVSFKNRWLDEFFPKKAA